MILTKRETAVLTAVVETYVETAQPVSSRSLAPGLGLSPASLRATMAALTEKEYLLQPHTSAGRIPTVAAFRYYLDQVLTLGPLPRREQSRLHEHILPGEGDLTQVLRRAARSISSLTRQVCVVMAPRQDLARWRQIDFVLLRPGMIMAVLVMQGGLISNRLLQMDDRLSADDLVRYGNYLNSLFEGAPPRRCAAKSSASSQACARPWTPTAGPGSWPPRHWPRRSSPKFSSVARAT